MNEYEQPQINTTPYATPMQQYGSNILMLTNPENELYKMELTFRCMKMDKDGNSIPSGDPLMNEYGINSIIGTVQSMVNQVTVMSNLNKAEIPMLMDFLGDTLSKDLMINRVPYGIKNFASRDKIFFTALSTCFITLKRGYEEGDRRFWKGSQQEIHTTIENSNKKNGMFSSLNPWK